MSVIWNFLNPEGHQNPISGSKVMAILLKVWISPIGGGKGRRLQPAQQACVFFGGPGPTAVQRTLIIILQVDFQSILLVLFYCMYFVF